MVTVAHATPPPAVAEHRAPQLRAKRRGQAKRPKPLLHFVANHL